MTRTELMQQVAATVAATPLDQRPLINYNGDVSHMDDEQFTEYLIMQEEMKDYVPPKSSEELIAELRNENEALKERVVQSEGALIELAGLIGGGV